jgi:hypothetical protein
MELPKGWYTAQRTYKIAYAYAFQFGIMYVPRQMAAFGARLACSTLAVTACLGEATPYGPYEHLLSTVANVLATRALVMTAGSLEALWSAFPPVGVLEQRAMTALTRDLRYARLTLDLSDDDVHTAAWAVEKYDPYMALWRDEDDNTVTPASVAALLRRWDGLSLTLEGINQDAWSAAQTYREGETHRALGWAQRTKAYKEAHPDVHTGETDPDRHTEPPQPGGAGAHDGVLRAAAREQHDPLSAQPDSDLGRHE